MPITIVGDPSVASSPGGEPRILPPVRMVRPAGGEARNAASIQQEIEAQGHWLELFRRLLLRNFGGADLGNVNVSTTVTPSGNNHPQYDTLTVEAAGHYQTQGRALRGRKLVWDGKISGNGTNAVGATPGAAVFHIAGGAAGVIGAGLDAPRVVSPYNLPGSGGGGGDGASGDGGDPSEFTHDEWSWMLPPFIHGLQRGSGDFGLALLRGGRGGGGGAGDGTNLGGGGGTSGSLICLLFNEVEIGVGATWESKGGNGGNASAGNCGGGGGGDGGGMLIVCGKLTGTPPAGTVTAGTGGTKTGTGTNGSGGNTGNSTVLVVEIGELL